MKSAIAVFLLLTCAARSVCGQSSNDNIDNRLLLLPETPISSQTNGNTVEWKCVDEKLTGRCIKYHNDQWFYFTALHAPIQYINISSQECRDLWGVQLVVIEGIPCETETYEIKACISLATQDDIFAELDNLEEGKEYLLNVDGYLHDFCSFEMELSLTPKGLPVVQSIQVEATSEVKNDTLNYYWETPDSLLSEITTYQIHRRKKNEMKFDLVEEFKTRQDAFGVIRKRFEYQQVITPDNNPWTYKLIAITTESSYLVDEFAASAHWLTKTKSRYSIVPGITLTTAADFSIELRDYLLGVTIEKSNIHFDPGESNPHSFDVTEYIELGVTRFQIIITNLDTGERSYEDYEYIKPEGLKKMK